MFEVEIAKGVEYLDQDLGQDWPKMIDLHTLDMHGCIECVIGQLYGDFFQRFTVEEGESFGFSLENYDLYGQLGTEWKAKIAQLRIERGHLEPSEQERLSLLEPTPFDSGVCHCGEFVPAGRLHEHKCFSWEERERLNDQERLAYCGYEEF